MAAIDVLASGSSGNLYTVTSNHSLIMLDCGLPLKSIQHLLNYRLPDAVLVTHEHMDHAKAVKDLLRLGIDCYMSAGTAQALGVSGHRVKIMQSKQTVKIRDFRVSAFDTEHDAAEPLGFVIEDAEDKILYATDTYYLRYKFSGLTKLMLECNYDAKILQDNFSRGYIDKTLVQRIVKSHFSLTNVKKFLRANDLSRVIEIWLIHLSDANSDSGNFKKEIAALTGLPVYVA